MTLPSVQQLLYTVLTISETTLDGRGISYDSIHCLLEAVTTATGRVHRLRMVYNRSAKSGPWPAYTSVGYKSHTFSENTWTIVGRGNTFSMSDSIMLSITRVDAERYDVLFQIKDSTGKVRYTRSTGPNIKAHILTLEQ